MKLIKLIISVLTLSIFTSSFGNASSAYTGPDLSGESLTILGPWMAPEDESFRDVISIFENVFEKYSLAISGQLSYTLCIFCESTMSISFFVITIEREQYLTNKILD